MPEVEIILDPETGLPTITTVDLLEDYWADFLCFRRDAILSARHGDRLRTHRYLRAALFTFLNYLSGMANRWIHSNSVPDEDLSSRMALSDRLAEIADRFPSEAPPKVDVDFLTTLALRCSNLLPSDEKDLFQSLAVEQIDSAWQRVVVWLQEFSTRTGLPLHADTRSLALPFMSVIAGEFHEDYQDFDALGDDPHPFQDPPGTWEVIEPDPEPNQVQK